MERVITPKGEGWRVGASSDGTITVMLDNGRQLAFPKDQVAPVRQDKAAEPTPAGDAYDFTQDGVTRRITVVNWEGGERGHYVCFVDTQGNRGSLHSNAWNMAIAMGDLVKITDESVMDESDHAEAAAQAACEGYTTVDEWVTDTQAALAEGPVADKAPGTDVAWVEGFLAWADDNAHRVDRMVVTGEVVRTEDLPGEIIPVTITLVTVDKHRRPLLAESVEHFKVNAAPGGRRVHNREFNHQVKAFRDLTNCCEQGPKVGPHLHMSAQPTVIQSARYGNMGKAHTVHTVTVGDIITINGRPFILTNDHWAADPLLVPAS